MNFDRKNFNNEELIHFYRSILLPRMIEEKMLLLLRQGKISKWFSGIGQEAIAVGAAMAMEPDEWIMPLHRNLGVFTTRKMPLRKLFQQWQGSRDGYSKGRERSFHFGSPEHAICGMISHLGPQLGVADGVALAYKLDKKKKAALAFTGEGGTSEGDFHEALNTASVWDLPVIFLVENNGYALSTPVSEQYRCESLVYKAEGYGMEGVRIDGNNILTVYDTLKGVREYCIKYQRPYLVECMTFRMRGHEEASGIKYVPATLLEDWGRKDPIMTFEDFLRGEGALNDQLIGKIHEEIRQYIESELAAAPDTHVVVPDTGEELKDVYATRRDQPSAAGPAPSTDHELSANAQSANPALSANPGLAKPVPTAAVPSSSHNISDATNPAPTALSPSSPSPNIPPVDNDSLAAGIPLTDEPEPIPGDPYATSKFRRSKFPQALAKPTATSQKPATASSSNPATPSAPTSISPATPVRPAASASPTPIPSGPSSEKRLLDAIRDGLRTSMQQHPQLILMGQDIAEYGGAFKITEGFLEEFGKGRVRNTPLCESAIIGCTLGLSLEGYKSVMEMQFADFVTAGFNQIVNNLAKVHYRWGQKADTVIRMPTGAGVGAGPFHSQSNEAWFVHTPGLKVVYPATPEDAKGLLIAAINDPNPVLYFEHKALYRGISGLVPDGSYETPIGKARHVQQGEDVTIITYGAGAHWATEYADRHPDISFEILDLRSLLPLDYDAIRAAVSATGKVLVLYEDTLTGGVGAEVAAWIGEHCFSSLDAPVLRCASLDTPVPFNIELEKNFLAKSRLDGYIKRLMEY
jgi:pyruvate/2-oxoglutarate/acetoin dehydrogenase E1 component/TPP-dependent pyruvate/acetoin dehydrogenase alpha subunit